MAIIDFSTTGYYLITEDVPLSNSEVAIGKDSILCFRGGRLVNDTDPKETITLKGDNITIEAGPVQIFDGPFEFKASDGVNQHYWNIECAYPQWFGAKNCAAEAYAAYKKLKKITSTGEGENKRYYVKDNYAQLAMSLSGPMGRVASRAIA